MERAKQIELIKELLSRIDSGTNVDAGGLRKNPVSSYTDPDVAAKEWQEFFRSRPQLIGLSADLPEPNSFLTMDDLGFPLLATRDSAGAFHAFVNSCRHRGAVVEGRERGTARRFACPFHAWTYDGEGSLVGLPKQDHFGEIDTDSQSLLELAAVEWHGLLFVHPDPSAALDVDDLLGDELAAELAHWDYGELTYLDQDSYDVRCNWKLAMDTFGETYHFSSLHKDSLYNAFHGNVQCYDTFGTHHRMILTRREIDEMRERPEDEWDITTAALPVYYLFPNVQLMPFREGCYLVRAYPVPGDPGRHVSRISFYLRPGVDQSAMYADGDRSEMPEAFADLDMQRFIAETFAAIIRDEDYAMSASQQQSAESGLITHSIFGRNEPALHHYHSTYRSLLGMEPLPLLDEAEV